MKIERTKLVSYLKDLLSICKNGGEFLLTGDKMILFDGIAGVIAPQPIDSKIRGVVRAKEFMRVLEKFPTAEVDIYESKGGLMLYGNRSRCSIPMGADTSVVTDMNDVLKDTDVSLFDPIPEGFVSALNTARHFGMQASYGILSGVLVSENTVTSTDNHRIFQATLPTAVPGSPFLVPCAQVPSIVTHAPTDMRIVNGWAVFSNDKDIIFCCRLLSALEDGKFPDPSAHLNVEGTQIRLPVKEISTILAILEVFLNSVPIDEQKSVDMRVSPKLIRLRAAGPNGWYEEIIKRGGSEEDTIEFSVHPKFLKQILDNVSEDTVDIIVGKHTLLFHGEAQKYVCVRSWPEEKE